MDSTHLHLLLNHFPIIGTLIGSGLLIWGFIKKQNNIKSVAAAILAVMSVIAIPVFLTGEPAEESIENLPGVSESIIGLHEEAAEIAIWLMGITGLASLLALVFAWQKRKTANAIYLTALVLSLICFAAMARTGYLGGQIRHSEIRTGNGTQQENGKEGVEKGGIEKEVNEKQKDND